jgi:hypothetical protein
VDLSRKSIERGDFPRAADGLDPEAVAEHLRAVADAVEELSRSDAAAPSSGERVRAIVDAAERSAAELEAAARADAERIRAQVLADVERVKLLAAEVGERAAKAVRGLDAAVAETPAPPPEKVPEPQPERTEETKEERPRKGGEAPRLIALNMMLDGSPREEVARYLDENFDLDDPGEILDEVWSQAKG